MCRGQINLHNQKTSNCTNQMQVIFCAPSPALSTGLAVLLAQTLRWVLEPIASREEITNVLKAIELLNNCWV